MKRLLVGLAASILLAVPAFAEEGEATPPPATTPPVKVAPKADHPADTHHGKPKGEYHEGHWGWHKGLCWSHVHHRWVHCDPHHHY